MLSQFKQEIKLNKQQTIEDADITENEKLLFRDEFASLFSQIIEEDHISILSDKEKSPDFK
jgi:hypothetical protein